MHTPRRAFIAGLAGLATGARALASAPARQPGEPIRPYGERSPHEKSARWLLPSATPQAATSRTPLQDLHGIITPSSLHFERHHSGVPQIDPAEHELLIAGLVERPLVLRLEDLLRLPAVSRIHFIECAGNSTRVYFGGETPTAQLSHGLLSCSEWTGVPLTNVLREAGVKPAARWLIAEGGDAGRYQRSIPLEKALDDVLIAYGQNGEAVRPEQGYPLRLVVPGWEGSTHVKWLRRLSAASEPAMARDETDKYTDLQGDGKARIFTFLMEAKSVITRPSGGHRLSARGFHQISGIAWSGRGRITRVEVSVDGGGSWHEAMLQEPVLSKAFTRFTLPWRWEGEEALLQSRCTDETGYRQPTLAQLRALRGPRMEDHCNGIMSWRIERSGEVRDAG